MKILQFQTPHGIFCTCHNDVVFVEHLSRGTVFEEELIFQYIFPLFKSMDPTIPKVLVDVGGHIGSHTVLYAKYIPNATVHTFEPQHVLYQLLQQNLFQNQLSNVITYPYAVGETGGTCTMSGMLYDGYNTPVTYETDQLLNYGGVSVGKGGEKVAMCSIDSLGLSACHYMKIDVEGAESLVLLGALQTLRAHRPVLFLEHSDKHVTEEMKESMGIPKERTIEDALGILEKEKYQCFPVEGGNVLALPIEKALDLTTFM